MSNRSVCSSPGCQSEAKVRGMCSPCYGRAYRAGEIQPMLKVGTHSLADVDVEARTAVCVICGPTKIRLRGGRRGHECMTLHRKHRGRRDRSASAAARRRWKYGLSAEDHAAMLQSQAGLCAICGESPDQLVVDHCHETGQVRGLLCRNCNLALGHMRDDPGALVSAARYLASVGA